MPRPDLNKFKNIEKKLDIENGQDDWNPAHLGLFHFILVNSSVSDFLDVK